MSLELDESSVNMLRGAFDTAKCLVAATQPADFSDDEEQEIEVEEEDDVASVATSSSNAASYYPLIIALRHVIPSTQAVSPAQVEASKPFLDKTPVEISTAVCAHTAKEVCGLEQTREAMLVKVFGIIASIDRSFLDHLIYGDLPAAVLYESESNDYANLMLREAFNPHQSGCIYCIYLVDRRGLAPTTTEYREMIQCMRAYINPDWKNTDSELVAIDRFKKTSSVKSFKDGSRKYLKVNEDEPDADTNRRKKAKVFCDHLESLLADTSDEDLPFYMPLRHIGITRKFEARAIQHKNHQSSNWLLGLAESCLNFVAPGKFIQFTLPICLIPSWDMASIAEVVITYLAKSYYKSGVGINAFSPGRSHGFTSNLDTEYTNLWVFLHSPYQKNCETQQKMWEERLAWLKSKVAEEDAEIARLKALEAEAELNMGSTMQKFKDVKEATDAWIDLLKLINDIASRR